MRLCGIPEVFGYMVGWHLSRIVCEIIGRLVGFLRYLAMVGWQLSRIGCETMWLASVDS